MVWSTFVPADRSIWDLNTNSFTNEVRLPPRMRCDPRDENGTVPLHGPKAERVSKNVYVVSTVPGEVPLPFRLITKAEPAASFFRTTLGYVLVHSSVRSSTPFRRA